MKIRTFRLVWANGEIEIIKGTSIVDAYTRAGYSYGSLKALDYYEEVKEDPND